MTNAIVTPSAGEGPADRENKMNSTTELKKVELVLNENQLCTLITMAQQGVDIVKLGHSRQDTQEVLTVLRDALAHLI